MVWKGKVSFQSYFWRLKILRSKNCTNKHTLKRVVAHELTHEAGDWLSWAVNWLTAPQWTRGSSFLDEWFSLDDGPDIAR